MKSISIGILQAIIVLTGMVAVIVLLWLPSIEGRAANLDLFSIYSDPFILYGYAASIAFFIALYKLFRLLTYRRQHQLFSPAAVKAVSVIKYCAIVLSISIVLAGLFIKFFHHKEDDPAGFLALAIVACIVSVGVAVVAARFEKHLQHTIVIKQGNKGKQPAL